MAKQKNLDTNFSQAIGAAHDSKIKAMLNKFCIDMVKLFDFFPLK